jgi:hypothetical protein
MIAQSMSFVVVSSLLQKPEEALKLRCAALDHATHL